MRQSLFFISAFLCGTAWGQTLLILPDNEHHRAMAFDPFDGHLVNSDFISDITGSVGGDHFSSEIIETGHHTLAVLDGSASAIYEYSYSGTYLRTISSDTGLGGMMGGFIVNGDLYSGGSNKSLIKTDMATGSVQTLATGLDSQVSDVAFGNQLLVSKAHGVAEFSFNGASLGSFFTDQDYFGEQLARTGDGYILGEWTPEHGKITILDAFGNIVHQSPPPYLFQEKYGVAQLGNGKILFTSYRSVSIYDPTDDSIALVYAGSKLSSFIDALAVPEPSMIFSLGLGACILRRHKRSKR